MMNLRPHSYGPQSLLAFGVRYHIAVYRAEGRRCKSLGMAIAYRACVQTAWAIRKEFRDCRVGEVA